jgi:hypothetical protein
MPNRTPRSSFNADILALFLELDRTSDRKRNSRKFKDGEHELMRQLDLTDEFWTMNSVLDRGGVCHPAGHIANEHWRRCRELRKVLLAAVAEQERAPARRSAEARLLS